MKPFRSLCALSIVGTLILVGCQSGSNAPKERIYDIKGTVVAVDAKKPSVKLDHQDIPGFMKAMVMEFDAAGPKVVEGLQPGDKVHGKLKVEAGSTTITVLDRQP